MSMVLDAATAPGAGDERAGLKAKGTGPRQYARAIAAALHKNRQPAAIRR